MNKVGYSGTIDIDLTLTEVITGESAWSIIKSADKYNKAPPNNKQYLLAKFKIKINKLSKGDNFGTHLLSFAVIIIREFHTQMNLNGFED
jgi:hypothetical protein